MEKTKRKMLKKVILNQVILFVAVIVVVIMAVNVKLESDKIISLTLSVLQKESNSYAAEIYNWWSSIEGRVNQIADVYRNIPEQSDDATLELLMKLTADDPDSQDIYMAFGDTGVFLDGSGWKPDSSFVFTDRAWYTGAISKGGQIYTSDPYLDASTGKTCLACSVLIRDKVVLSSDINFDKVSEKLNLFQSSSPDAKFYIINKEAQNILVSNVQSAVGETVSGSTDSLIMGLNKVWNTLLTTQNPEKPIEASTSAGEMMYFLTDIQDTSWVVVSAVPVSFMISSILNASVLTIAIALILLVILGILLQFIISKYMNPVTTVTERITDISDGNFMVSLEPVGNNEITTLSEHLNEYIKSMRGMLINLANISNEMNNSAGACFDISKSLSAANHEQGDAVEKLNSILSDMNDSIDEIANAATDLAQTSNNLTQNAETVRNLCDETMDSSKTGKEEMTAMTESVTTLNSTIKDLAGIIRETAKSVEEITGITETINAISEQTNLLALNASIEAARAGDMGKGFAVVASEVGTLASQSTEATENIRNLITGITKNIEEIDKKADACLKDMDNCIMGMDNANKSFATIYEDVEKATEGIVEITSGIEKINGVASNNAAATQEQASTINEILSLSDSIVQSSNKLVGETESLFDISKNLNGYSDTIKEDLSKYILTDK